MAKKQRDVSKIYSVELNPQAHKYAQENIKMNKVEGKVEAVLMDAVLACETISIFLIYLNNHIYHICLIYHILSDKFAKADNPLK